MGCRAGFATVDRLSPGGRQAPGSGSPTGSRMSGTGRCGAVWGASGSSFSRCVVAPMIGSRGVLVTDSGAATAGRVVATTDSSADLGALATSSGGGAMGVTGAAGAASSAASSAGLR